MKKLGLFLMFSVAAMLTFGRHGNNASSEFRLSTSDYSNVVLIFDDQYFSPSNFHLLKNVRPGNHKVIVKRVFHNHHGNGGRGIVVYDGMVNIQPRTKLKARLGHHNNLRFFTEPLYAYNYEYNNNNYGMYNNWNNNQSYCGTGIVTTNYGYNNNTNMGNSNFYQLKQTIQNVSFDNAKLSIAKQAVSSGYYTSQQILELMNLMTFENTKLDFAKYAFSYVQDPQNYYIINNGFSFSSSVRDLTEFTSMY